MTFTENYHIRTEETPELTARRERIEAMLQHMLVMQDASNKSLAPDWQQKGFRYVTATVVEAAELIDHLDWKWWKAGQTNIGQAQMEAVDIWHFLLSRIIMQEPGLLYKSREEVPGEDLAAYFRATYLLRFLALKALRSPGVCEDIVVADVIRDTEYFVKATLADAYAATDSVGYFFRVLSSLGLSFEQLYKKYIGKNILNSFRWSNGYKTPGKYVKDWLGEEDNEFLTRTLSSTDLVGPELEDFVCKELARRYNEVLKG